MSAHPILVNGKWQPSNGREAFHAENPATGEVLNDRYPVSDWKDIDLVLQAAVEAAPKVAANAAGVAAFLNKLAAKMESRAAEIVAIAAQETGLPVTPRLQGIELPRTVTQLRQAAVAAETASWAMPTIDTKNNIRSVLAPLGPVLVIGPNNFPLAFNGICGGDFAAALAAGCPVIAKGHPSHPTTTRLIAEDVPALLAECGLPAATVQLVYRMSPDTGLRVAADPRLGSLAFTGSRRAGMSIKEAADKVGKPVFMEMSSLNPVLILPGALQERFDKVADEFADSALAGTGQFCTNPGLTILLAGPKADAFIQAIKQRYESRKPGVLLSRGVAKALNESVGILEGAGAKRITSVPSDLPKTGCVCPNTLLHVSGAHFLAHAEKMQTEAFGNASLFVTAESPDQVVEIIATLEGNLTGCLYSASNGEDDALYDKFAPLLRAKVGRLLNDKMPTGVALSPAMNHGGPFPSTGHPHFTAVGIPASVRRFTMLQSFDNVRPHRLPAILQNKNPNGKIWRSIDGNWSQGDVG